jgi:hypothetical protein
MNTDALLEIPYGDYVELDILVVDEEEVPFDITPYQKRFTIKAQKTDPDTMALITKISPSSDIIDIGNGIVKIILHPDETRLPPGSYYFDLKLYRNGIVITPVVGKIKVLEVVWKGEEP